MDFPIDCIDIKKILNRFALNSDRSLPEVKAPFKKQLSPNNKRLILDKNFLKINATEDESRQSRIKIIKPRFAFNLVSKSPTQRSAEKHLKEQKLEPYKRKKQFPLKDKILERISVTEPSQAVEIVNEFTSVRIGNDVELVATELVYPNKGNVKPLAGGNVVQPCIRLNRNPNENKTIKLCSLLTEEQREQHRKTLDSQLGLAGDLNGLNLFRRRRNRQTLNGLNALNTFQNKTGIVNHKRTLSKTINFQDFKLEEKRVRFSSVKKDLILPWVN
jgi:hypothetical protein